MPFYKLRHSERLLFGVWMLLGLCMSIIYKSNLKAMLTAQKVEIPFKTLEELLVAHDYTVHLHRGSSLMVLGGVSHSVF